ncbi:MAG: glutamine-hydrolyzing GMP synthase [Chitinophagales bacterium]|nr:glutamine-hydrolyzing GMP synthase [Chitinophagales bacterium]
MKQSIIILDFGSQYNQLIARRIRELGVYAEILPYYTPIKKIIKHHPIGLILSGGPSSVFSEKAALVEKELFELGIPILGICYGMQLIAHILGGEVKKGVKGEYGKAELSIYRKDRLFDDIPSNLTVWMSHFDEVATVPSGFKVTGSSTIKIASMADISRQIYAVQFHPEVTHTEYGTTIFKNFLFKICKAKKNWALNDFITTEIKRIQEIVGEKHVILGLSGGVDSSVAAVLIHKAIGNQLTCIFVDTGLLRKNEGKKVMENYGKHFNMNIKMVDASEGFLTHLKGIEDPEAKRKSIGHDFITVFNEEARKFNNATFLAQGTIYPDVIESSAVGGVSATIKSHHNVGGLPEDLKFKLLEPLVGLFKDEVRKVGIELGIPHELVYRHPFPGPGLGIRIVGEVNSEKVKILQEADAIFIEELYRNQLYEQTSQAFVGLLPVKSVGVMGDERTYEYTAVIRAVNTLDFMTATWSKLPYEFLEVVSNRIINEVKGINRVVYDISSKPPATIEWE